MLIRSSFRWLRSRTRRAQRIRSSKTRLASPPSLAHASSTPARPCGRPERESASLRARVRAPTPRASSAFLEEISSSRSSPGCNRALPSLSSRVSKSRPAASSRSSACSSSEAAIGLLGLAPEQFPHGLEEAIGDDVGLDLQAPFGDGLADLRDLGRIDPVAALQLAFERLKLRTQGADLNIHALARAVLCRAGAGGPVVAQDFAGQGRGQLVVDLHVSSPIR